MTTIAIRKSLYEYIRFANEKKVKALYTIIEDEIKEKHDVWTSEFIKEMEERSQELTGNNSIGKDWKSVQKKAKNILNKSKK